MTRNTLYVHLSLSSHSNNGILTKQNLQAALAAQHAECTQQIRRQAARYEHEMAEVRTALRDAIAEKAELEARLESAPLTLPDAEEQGPDLEALAAEQAQLHQQIAVLNRQLQALDETH